MATPTFQAGQVLSAGIHLNGIQREIQALHDNVVGAQLPFTGCNFAEGVIWAGVIRHKYNSFYYSVSCSDASALPVTIKFNNTTVVTIIVAGASSGTVSLVGKGLTVNEFYDVTLSTNVMEIYMLREVQTLTLPALASFADDTIPSAAQWQALSDYADELTVGQSAPGPLGMVNGGWRDYQFNWTVWTGTMNHRCRYLYYKFWMARPFGDSEDGNPPWMNATIDINNGTPVLRRRIYARGYSIADPGTMDFAQAESSERYWEGRLDLDGLGLTVGADYRLRLYGDIGTYWDTTRDLRLVYFYEGPAAAEQLAGWTPFTTWAHGNWAYGDGGAGAKVVTIKNNLELLGGVVTYANYASRNFKQNLGLYGVRRKRFLHYRGDAPSLAFSQRGVWTTSALPRADTRWLALDFESLDGMYPGTYYTLAGAKAVEDDVP